MIASTEHTHILLVEGKDDFHLIKHLLAKHRISAEAYDKDRPFRGLAIKEMQGKEKFRQNAQEFLESGSITKLGIVLDADQSASSAWQSVQNLLEQYGEISWPAQTSSGVVATLTRRSLPPMDVGIWIMPDNTNVGMIEHFASDLIADDDQLWSLAQTTVASLPEQRFAKPKTRKAELHTWLAWQAEPGKPMGVALSSGYLHHTTPTASAFVEWIKNVFTPEAS